MKDNSFKMIEQAATTMTAAIMEHYSGDNKIWIFAGPGRNGAYSLAVGRLLIKEGCNVECFLFNPYRELSKDCAISKRGFLHKRDVVFTEISDSFTPPEIRHNDIIVDGLFGSDLKKPLCGGFEALVYFINNTGAKIISIDVPSGWYVGRDSNDRTPIIHDSLTLKIKVSIPNSVTSIEDFAFAGCTELTYVTIPDSVTNIGNNAFAGCTGLTSIIIPDSVTNIGKNAFNGCSGLKSISIPESVTNIGSAALSNCCRLTSVAIPDSVTTIEGFAFNGCKGLTSVVIPDSVTNIGLSAFNGCSGLTSLTIPNSVTTIEDFAFNGCSGLSFMAIPNSITSIEDGVFFGCRGLTSVTIPNSVTKIGKKAFGGCSGLTSISIPDSLTEIELTAFDGCPISENIRKRFRKKYYEDSNNTAFQKLLGIINEEPDDTDFEQLLDLL